MQNNEEEKNIVCSYHIVVVFTYIWQQKGIALKLILPAVQMWKQQGVNSLNKRFICPNMESQFSNTKCFIFVVAKFLLWNNDN